MSTDKVKDQGKHLGKTMNAATLLTMNSNTIMQQPDIKLDDPELKSLPEHQSAARGHCDVWLKNIWPSIISITTDIIDYANTFDSSYQSLTGLVPRLQKGDEAAKKEFLQVLDQVLLPTLKEKKANSSKVASDTASLKTNFETDYQKFLTDSTAAAKIYTDKDGKLKVLATSLDEAKAQAHALSTELIDVGIGEGILLAVIAVISVASGGVAATLEGGVVAVGKLLSNSIGEAYAKAVKAESDIQNEITALKMQLQYLKTIQGQIGGVATNLEDAVKASQNVSDGWTTLANELSSLIGHLDKISPEEAAVVITTQLNTSKADWDVVLKQAKVLAPSGQIPVKQYQGMDSFLKDITPKQAA